MQRRVRTTARYGRAFANWLEGKLDEVRAAREDPKLSDSKAAELIGVSHAMVSRFRAALSLPSRATTRALVIGLNAQRVPATVAEVEELVLASDPHRAASAESHPPSGVHTASAVGGIIPAHGAAVGAGTEAALLAEVALPLLTGDMTAEERAYLEAFVRRVNQRRAQSGGVRDEPGRGGAGGPAD